MQQRLLFVAAASTAAFTHTAPLARAQWQPQQNISTSATAAIESAPVDYDGDGDVDFATALLNNDQVVINRNNGNGTFGVDLNRNYPFQWGGSGSSGNSSSEVYRGSAPASEPEIQAMIQFIDGREFQTALSVHTYSDLWLAPWGYVGQYPPAWAEIGEIGDLAVADNGYVHGPASLILYEADGVTFDYEYGVKGTYGWTPEIGSQSDGFWPPQSRIVPLAEENLMSFARTGLAAGAWLRPEAITLTEVGDGDGSFEAGEAVDVDALVRNSGRAGSGTATVDLATTSPFATVTVGQTSLSVASFTTGTGAAPLRSVIVALSSRRSSRRRSCHSPRLANRIAVTIAPALIQDRCLDQMLMLASRPARTAVVMKR